jgi:hypothetical protein
MHRIFVTLTSLAGLLCCQRDMVPRVLTHYGIGNSSAPWDRPSIFHNGVDYLAGPRSEVRSIADGVVSVTRTTHLGDVVSIWHPQIGLMAEYGHVQDIVVKEGDHVSRGQRVALIWEGSGDWSAHLHFMACRATCSEFTSGLVDPARLSMTCSLRDVERPLFPSGCPDRDDIDSYTD